MSAQLYRGGVVAANLLCVAGIALLGVRAFRGSPADPAEALPTDFNPTRYEVRSEGQGKSSINEHATTWVELDRPLPPPPPPPTPPPEPERITLSDLEARYVVVMASQNEKNPKLSSVIVQPRGGGNPVVLGVEDPFDGYTVKSVVVKGQGEEREAVVTFDQGGQQRTIRLTRK